MKIFTFLFCLFFLSFLKAQSSFISQEELGKKYGEDKILTIVKVEEQKKDNQYEVIKTTRYIIEFNKMGNIKKQIVNDTAYGTPMDREYTFEYNGSFSEELIKIEETRMSDKALTKTYKYTWDDGGMFILKEEIIDEWGDVITTKIFETGYCDESLLSKKDNEIGVDYCEDEFVDKLTLNYKIVRMFKDGYLYKFVKFANNDEQQVIYTTQYFYNDKWQLTKEVKTMNSNGKSIETIYEYDEDNRLLVKKQGFVKFNLTYNFDENTQTLTTIETPANGSKRWIEYQTITIK